MFENEFKGKVVLVTGGSRGIGFAAVKGFLAAGAKVYFLSHYEETGAKALAALKEINPDYEVMTKAIDLCDYKAVQELYKEIIAKWGRLDVLVNNAGVCEYAPLEDHTTAQWDKVIATDLTSVFLMTREVAPLFREQGYGRVVNIASVGAIQAGATQIGYFAAKGAVLQVTRALAAELAPYGVLVNAIAPGVFDTEMTHDALEAEGSLVLKNRTVLKRFADPVELVPQMLVFASEANTYCTGQTIYVDGGLTSQL